MRSSIPTSIKLKKEVSKSEKEITIKKIFVHQNDDILSRSCLGYHQRVHLPQETPFSIIVEAILLEILKTSDFHF